MNRYQRVSRPEWILLAAVLVGGCADGGEEATGTSGPGDDATEATTDAGVPGDGDGDGDGDGLPEVLSLRFAHFAPGASGVDACVAAAEGQTFEGPLLGSPGVAFRGGARVIEVSPASEPVVRWVAAGADDCEVALDGTSDTPVGLEGAGAAMVALTDADGISPSNDLQTRVLVSPTVEIPVDSRRFFVRFWNLAVDADEVSLKQNLCTNPFAAFDSTAYGQPGFSPNNQGPVFSASVTAGRDDFTTDIVVCGAGEAPLVQISDFVFNKGELQLVVLSGDGTDTSPWDVTRCVENELVSMDCESGLADPPSLRALP